MRVTAQLDAMTTLRTFAWLFTRLPRKETLLPNFYQVGVLSLPVIALTGTFIGMVLAVQSFFTFRQLGLETYLGAVINMTLVRELGPVLAATMLAGRVGSAMAAELGTMRVTAQLDAMTTLRTDPYRYLIAPRLFAALISLPLLVLIANSIGIFGGYMLSVYKLGFNASGYLATTREFLVADDFMMALVKAGVFGFFIALMGCYHGFRTEGGAAGVGRATTNAVVSSFILILLSNLMITVMAFG
jgi:phospholipid/cholesterol/gamma-HCH transport system permease protein